jgi:predicted RNA-binding protein associated with RNAse of E/G family
MPRVNDPIRVLKLDLQGKVTWQYDGRVVSLLPDGLVLEALFNRPEDMPFQDVVFKHNDRFVETYYTDRWYNIYEIYDRDDGRLKGHYCNVCRPAVLGPGTVSFVDLALDLWVSISGKQTVLDRDEFEALTLQPGERANALDALARLRALFKTKQPPQ